MSDEEERLVIWEGPLEEGMPHGQGVMQFPPPLPENEVCGVFYTPLNSCRAKSRNMFLLPPFFPRNTPSFPTRDIMHTLLLFDYSP